ncbi:hypothetical protein G647_04785 [Cladophialophora carrionii CBS 160.54]|uniref:UBA domain-containing protein n=1 Tax=Cladophialophora carrionii CBS 160.54 TaxID=1279043 RepID=V9D7U6_9EURO|nr:uncharacterized protein G647_04785 [Cladophialophora carrionii CBS 160.54]ETI22989.1 hypothetical protein G647_04785 [Cladophialophora carrionii CBS 160.54]
MAQPTDDLISQVCAITALDEESAKVLLKKNNNDANNAINAWLENPERSIIPEPVSQSPAASGVEDWLSKGAYAGSLQSLAGSRQYPM